MASGPIPGDEDSREWQKHSDIKNGGKMNARKSVNKPRNSSGGRHGSSMKALAKSEYDNNFTQKQFPLVRRFDAAAAAAASDDESSSEGNEQPGAPNVSNRIAGYTLIDSHVNINIESLSKHEARVLKRKLRSELDQVRSFVKCIEAKRGGSGAYSNNNCTQSQNFDNEVAVAREVEVEVDRTTVSGGVKMNSELGFAGPQSSRPLKRSRPLEGSSGVTKFSEQEKKISRPHPRNSDFVVGKHKTPPESNKKSKKNTTMADYNVSGIRDGGVGLDKGLLKSCTNLLAKLMKDKFGWIFNKPVDAKALGLLDYYTIVKNPMDLGTVKTRLNKNWYKSPKEFAEDVRLTFHNAMLYNPKEQDTHVIAKRLLATFEENWPANIDVERNHSKKSNLYRDVDFQTPTTSRRAAAHDRPDYLPIQPSTHASFENGVLERVMKPVVDTTSSRKSTSRHEERERTPDSKNNGNNDEDHDDKKRDMTFDEKQQLSLSLQNLPLDKVESLVQIIRDKNPEICQQDDEIELEIDTLDPETLWELDRFVDDYHKSLSTTKQTHNEHDFQPVVAEAEKSNADTSLAADVVGTPKVAETVEKISATGNESGSSSSSSSSSSDSGSSSSDSDSDNSSRHQSDGADSPISI